MARREQCANTRRVRKIEYKGKIYSMTQLADLLGIPYGTLRSRVQTGKSISAITSKVQLVRPSGKAFYNPVENLWLKML